MAGREKFGMAKALEDEQTRTRTHDPVEQALTKLEALKAEQRYVPGARSERDCGISNGMQKTIPEILSTLFCSSPVEPLDDNTDLVDVEDDE